MKHARKKPESTVKFFEDVTSREKLLMMGVVVTLLVQWIGLSLSP